MTDICIRQKDNLTHTIFIVQPGGRCFPEDNFQIAMGWYEAGLLAGLSKETMNRIIALREGRRKEL